MLTQELLKKVRRIEITTRRMVTDLFAGEYHSVFKGRGMEFDEVREYQIGDDIRAIDWNVTARTGRAHVKKFIEERELTVMLLIDASRSCFFSTGNKLKVQLAAEIAAVLAFAAIRNHDKVGLLFFTDRVEKFIPPRKGQQNVLRLIREILSFRPAGQGTDLEAALDYLNRLSHRRTILFVVSDFFESSLKGSGAADPIFKRSLAVAARRHDLIAVHLVDPIEEGRVPEGMFLFEDAETGDSVLVDGSDRAFVDRYRAQADARQTALARTFRSVGVDEITVRTDRPYLDEMVRFFAERRRRAR